MQYKSQYQQDKIVNELLKGKRNGVFVDIGAHNGVDLSNSYFFEKELCWEGICIEPNPKAFRLLQSKRNCVCINKALSDRIGFAKFQQNYGSTSVLSGIVDSYDPDHLERVTRENKEGNIVPTFIEVETDLLSNVLDEYGYTNIDYMSIDTEGSEYDILKDFDFTKYHISVLDIEFNETTSNRSRALLDKVVKGGFSQYIPCHCDIIFVNDSLII
jgi:FkbM family methyltransferase